MRQLLGWSGWVQAPVAQTSFVHEMLSLVHPLPSAFGAVAHPPAPSHVEEAWQSVGTQL